MGASSRSTSARRKASLGSGYIPKTYQTTCLANSEGLFAYYQYAETGFILTCRMASGSRLGLGRASPARRICRRSTSRELTEIAANKAVKSQKPRAIEPGRYTTIIEPRPAARLLSTMMGAFNAARRRRIRRRRRRLQLRRHRPAVRQRRRHAEDRPEAVQRQLHAEERHRQPDPAPDADHERRPGAQPVTWIEKGVLKNLYYDAATARARRRCAVARRRRT